MKLVLLACLVCVAVAGAEWCKEGKVDGPVSAVKGGTGDAKDGWKATGRFGHIVIKGDGTYNYVVDVKSDLVKYFASRPNVLVDRFHITTPSGDKEISFDVATIPKPGEEKKDDKKKDDAKKDDTKKDDGKKDDKKKDDGKKDDKKKDDGKKGKKGGPIPGSVPLIDGHYYKGDQGAGVRAVQTNLKALGYDIAIDGIYGPQTTDRVSKFQKSVGLQGLGMVGPKTMAKLIEKTGQKKGDANNHGGVQPPAGNGKGGSKGKGGGDGGAPADAPNWMKIALKENAKRIIEFKSGSNKEIEKYHVAAGLPGYKDDTPWCASFISWVMKTAGYKIARTGARALSWSDAWPEGKKLPGPVYGAIAVKTRNGGGHVGFVLGSIGSTYLAILGGNQGDTLSVAKYAKSVFHAYMVPKSYNAPSPSSLKPYKGSFGVAGKES